MLYTTILTIHLFCAFLFLGFLFVDNFYLSNISKLLGKERAHEAIEAIMVYVRRVVPYSLFLLVISGTYLFSISFGKINDSGLSSFQILLLIKVTLALWILLRLIFQKFFHIDPLVFKGHKLPMVLSIIIVIIAKFMWLV